MPQTPPTELRLELDRIETAIEHGRLKGIEDLSRLEPLVLEAAAQSPDCHPIARVARLLTRAKAKDAACQLLEKAHEMSPDSEFVGLALANALAENGKILRAFDVLNGFVRSNSCNAVLLSRAAELKFKLGDVEESLKLHSKATACDRNRTGGLVNALLAAGYHEDALAEARRLFVSPPADAGLCFSAIAAIVRFSKDEDEVARARIAFLALLGADATGGLWRARLYRAEQRLDRAVAEADRCLGQWPGNPLLLKERAVAALSVGHWGRDAAMLQEAVAVADDATDLRQRLETANALLAEFGGSLEQAAARPQQFASIRSPESVFELVAHAKALRRQPQGTGLVMIAHSLTAGGAERIVADTFRRLRADARFDWVKLYLFNLSHDSNSDFYLPLTGLRAAEPIVLDRNCELQKPFHFLPPDLGKTAQAIYNQIACDKPDIVHASLEPLTLSAGFAALLAGVPRIVLHTHNMRPTTLYRESTTAPRWRDCYRSLLSQHGVSLIGCAAASIADYADWIGLPDKTNLHVVYNGLNFDEFRPQNPDAAGALRDALNIPRDATVIGTAFKFRAEKRPHLWVDAARGVLDWRPDCRFIMFGDGPLLAETQAYIDRLGLAQHFTLPGLVADLHRWLPMLDLFLLCSSCEALPNVLLESQAAGVPVIAHHVGGIGETMIDGKTGVLVQEDSAAALSSAVLKAISDPFWRLRASKDGRAFVRKRFSPENMIENLSAILLHQDDCGAPAARIAAAGA
ncbi:MAG TPA: glycosyltransferase [Rhizomicrobium sp.]|nr:glycosyltransferase [Rhizomicrobium sp.]